MRRIQEQISFDRVSKRNNPESPLPQVKRKKIDFTLEMKGQEPIGNLMNKKEMKNFYHPSFE